MAIEYVDSTQLDSDLTSVANAIRAKSGGSSQLAFPAGFVSEIGNIPTGGGGGDDGKPVKLIDYDGTVLHSYTAMEFAALEALPATPTHTGLAAQGWNWTLEDAKTYVASYGTLTIGQMYNTSDGKTRLYLSVQPGALTITIRASRSLSGNLDWGDGTVESGTSSTMTHTYAAAGDYVVVINGDAYSSATLLYGYISAAFRQALTKAEIGNKVNVGTALQNCTSLTSITIPISVTSIDSNAFSYCTSLASVTIPSIVTSISNYVFNYCTSLARVAIPSGVTSIGDYAFAYCTSLTSVTIPSGVTSIGNSAFQNCGSITSVTIPSGVTSIGNFSFSYCTSLASVTIPSSVTSIGNSAFQYLNSALAFVFKPSSPPTVGTSVFSFLPPDCVIHVPTGSLSAYTSASNYPSTSTYTYVEDPA